MEEFSDIISRDDVICTNDLTNYLNARLQVTTARRVSWIHERSWCDLACPCSVEAKQTEVSVEALYIAVPCQSTVPTYVRTILRQVYSTSFTRWSRDTGSVCVPSGSLTQEKGDQSVRGTWRWRFFEDPPLFYLARTRKLEYHFVFSREMGISSSEPFTP